MTNIKNPVITERSWRRTKVITLEAFEWDMGYAAKVGARVHQWAGQDREGNPLEVVWVAGRETGALYLAYEIAERGQ